MTSEFDTARQAFEAGLQAQLAGHLAEAESHYRRSLQALPGRASTLANLGAALLAQGRAAEALPLLEQATDAAPAHADARGHLGETLLALSRPEPALRAFARLLALASPPPRAALRHAECLAQLGRIEESAAAAEALVQRHADWGEAWLLLGTLRKDLGRLAAAEEALQRALDLGTQPELVAWLLAGLRSARGDSVPALPPPGYVEALFDSYAADFDHHLGGLQYRAPERLLQGLPARRFARALDLGCGTGQMGKLVRPRVDRLEGLDLSGAMLAVARETGAYDALHQADLLKHLAQAEHASLDLVLASDVLNYLGALEPVFVAVKRVLAPGGVFGFTVEQAPDGADVTLLPSARYAHSAAHLDMLAARHGLVAAAAGQREALRTEQRRPVMGLLRWLTPRESAA